MAMTSRVVVTWFLLVLVVLTTAKQLTAEGDLVTDSQDKQVAPDSDVVFNADVTQSAEVIEPKVIEPKDEKSESVEATDKTIDVTDNKPLFTETIYNEVDEVPKKVTEDNDAKKTPETEAKVTVVDITPVKEEATEVSAPLESANKEMSIDLPVNDAAATPDPYQDPCEKKRCTGTGEVCIYDPNNNEAVCTCIPSCGIEKDPRQRVCSNFNITFSSECQLHRQVCLCTNNQKGCDSPDFAFLQLEYMGQCKDFKPCTSYEMEEYPKRMRDWLYVVMKEMGNRKSLNKPAMVTLEEAERHEKKWLLPVIWKFCDLDVTGDRQVTFEELLPVSGPLKTYEHCTGPFVTSCDVDKNQRISLNEWGSCLGLLPGEIVDMCATLRA